jgi:hypothetical protein
MEARACYVICDKECQTENSLNALAVLGWGEGEAAALATTSKMNSNAPTQVENPC